MTKERIKLTDTLPSALAKMSDGNPGAISAMMEIMKHTEKVDPDNVMGGMGVILSLDSYGIYGTDIYILYNDICDRKANLMIAVIRSVQLGILKSDVFKRACGIQDRSAKSLIPVDEIYKKVKEILPNFDKQELNVEHLTQDHLSVGDKVHYAPEYGESQNGIVKSFPDHTTETVFVVYHCGGEWDDYQNYTAAQTNISDLKLGWVEKVNN